MLYPPNLQPGSFVRRVNRFAAEVELAGKVRLVHVANSGRNRELFTPGRPVWVAPQSGPHRKTAFDLALVRFNRRWVSVDARLPNRLIEEAWTERRLRDFRTYSRLQREVPCGDSRLDFAFFRGDRTCWVEVKSVTLVRKGLALFPDAPTARGSRHLQLLSELVARGHAATALFVVQRDDARELRPFAEADPEFAVACREARRAGVQLRAFTCSVSPTSIELNGAVPVRLGRQR